MEIKIKVGKTKYKLSSADFLKNINKDENPFDLMSKANLDSYYKFYKSIPQNMISFFKEFNKAFEKYFDDSKPEIGKIPDSPDVYPANGHDIFNYVGRYGMGNFHCQIVLNFDGRLDFDKLSKAVRVSVDAEPVLGCQFVEGNPPYWKRLENLDNVMFCSFEEAPDCNEAIQRFLESPLDMDKDPKVKVKLIRSMSYDALVIKINHACCDGIGIIEYIHLLSDIYSNIDNQDGEFIPVPGARGRTDQDRLFKSLGIADPEALLIPGSDITIPTWSFPWKQCKSSITRIVTCRLPSNQLDKMSSYAKSKGATINDLILTAYYRALLKMGQPVYGAPMGVTVTVDLRRYLPNKKTEAIRNFSGAVSTRLSMVENEAFSDTLSRVNYMMKEIKNGYPGLQSAIGLERLEKIHFKDTLAYYKASSKTGKNMPQSPAFYGDRCVASVSNLGIISKSLIKFSDTNATDVYIIPPAVSAPGVLLEVGTYNSITTMSVGFFENTVLRDDVERLLNNIKDELVEGCI